MAEIRPVPPLQDRSRMIMALTFDNPKFATEPVHVQAFATEAYASLASLDKLTQGADKDLANVSHLRLLPLEDEVSRRLAEAAARNEARGGGGVEIGAPGAGPAAAAAAAAAAAPPSGPVQRTRQPSDDIRQPHSQAAGGGLAAAHLPPPPALPQPRAAGHPATAPPGPSMAMSGISGLSGLSAISLGPGRTDLSLDFTGLAAAAAQARAAEGGAGPSGAPPGPSILGLPPPLPPPSALRASTTREDQRQQVPGMASAASGPGKRQREPPTGAAAHGRTGPGPPGPPSIMAPSLPPAAPLPLPARALASRGPAPRLRQPSEDPRGGTDGAAGVSGAAAQGAVAAVLPVETERVARERKEARRVAATHLVCLQRDEKKPVKRSGSTYESRNVAPGARGGSGPSRAPGAADGAAAAAAAALDPSLRVKGTEVVLTVSIHDPARPGIIMQQLAVLGSQTLAALRDAMRCPMDTMAADLGARRPSGYFYFEGTFFSDDRAEEEGWEDYTEAIREFLVRNGVRAPPVPDRLASRLGGFRTLPMSQVTFSELWTRVGPAATGLYGHQGSCEHQLAIHDLRTWHPTDPPLVSDYPHETFRARRKLLSCCVCTHKVAERLTVGAPHSLEYLSRYCEDCYLRLHYDEEGNSLGAHKVMPYVGEIE